MSDSDIFVVADADSASDQTLQTLASILQGFQPKIVVEAGTYKGSFALTAARICPDAMVYTADMIDYNWRDLMRRNNITADQLVFVRGDFEEIAHRYPALVGAVDFAFIDSGWPMLEHEPGMRWRHYRAAQQWLRPGGIIAVDDVAATDWEGAEAIVAEATTYITTDRGLSLWRKPW